MRSSKSRSRNKNRNNRPTGNIVNRVFDSSGPEGKVRGTPQQIIDKYLQLHRDAVLAGDRVDAENFAQHAEHYTRMLAEAQREMNERREEQDRQNRERQAERDRERAEREKAERDEAAAPEPVAATPAPADPSEMEQPVVSFEEPASDLVETPEAAPEKPKRRRRTSKPKPTETPPPQEAAE